MRKFTKILESQDLGYKSFFGKKISHDEAFKDQLKSILIHIIMEEKKISEKSFREVDKVVEDMNESITSEILEEANKLYNEDKRLNFIGEIIYDKYFK